MATTKSLARIAPAETNDGEHSVDDADSDLDTVYRKHAETVSRWVRRLWGPRDAQDLMHEVFLVVQRRLPEFRGECAITTWLYSITVRVVVDRRRKERWRRWIWRRAEPELKSADRLVETPLGTALREQAASIVYSILDHMSERDRTLLILFELDGRSAREIADVLHMSEDSVWVGLHRARIRFRAAYAKRFGESASGAPHVQTTRR